MNDWPYGEDGVQQGDFTEQFRYPIINTSHPRWSYVTAVVVEDQQTSWSTYTTVRPTDDELRIVASFHDEYMEHWYGPREYGYRARVMNNRPFDIDGGANSRILVKRGDGDWAYRLKTWCHGPRFVPALHLGQEKHDLISLLDRIHTHGDDKPTQRWIDWKNAHPEMFASVTR